MNDNANQGPIEPPAVDPNVLKQAGAAADAEQSVDNVDNTITPCVCSPRWIEVKIVNDRNVPYADENCVLYMDLSVGSKIVKKTNSSGVVRFENVPENAKVYHVQLIDVLEAWKDARPANEAWLPKPDNYRKKDGTVHEVKPCVEADKQVIVLDKLTEAEKFAHFRQAYEDNAAYYTTSQPRVFNASPPKWSWGKGAVCNQHVNFFLGYWYNYNKDFTTSGSATFMGALTTLTSKNRSVTTVTHRGYKEFVTETAGPDLTYSFRSIGTQAKYTRVGGDHFDRATGAPNPAMAASLVDYNVYSVSDVIGKSKATSVSKARQWLNKNPTHMPNAQPSTGGGASTPSQQNPSAALSDAQVWDFIWNLSESDPDEAKLLRQLNNELLIDHHCGVLLKRANGLQTFSADSPSGTPIEMRSFADTDVKKRKLFYIAIWNLKTLRKGGYAPLDAETNEGKISIDNPPRFVQWT